MLAFWGEPTLRHCGRQAAEMRLVLRVVRLSMIVLSGAASTAGLASPGAARGAPRVRLDPPADAGCYPQKTVEVAGRSMFPLVKPGEKLLLLEGYYASRLPERYDVVAYRYAGREWPLMKIVYAIAGDRWEVLEDPGAYRIKVNGRLALDSPGNVLRIPKGEARRLKLYGESYPVIPEDALLILGHEPGSIDSSRFGLVDRRDLAGRLVRPPAAGKTGTGGLKSCSEAVRAAATWASEPSSE